MTQLAARLRFLVTEAGVYLSGLVLLKLPDQSERASERAREPGRQTDSPTHGLSFSKARAVGSSLLCLLSVLVAGGEAGRLTAPGRAAALEAPAGLSSRLPPPEGRGGLSLGAGVFTGRRSPQEDQASPALTRLRVPGKDELGNPPQARDFQGFRVLQPPLSWGFGRPSTLPREGRGGVRQNQLGPSAPGTFSEGPLAASSVNAACSFPSLSVRCLAV